MCPGGQWAGRLRQTVHCWCRTTGQAWCTGFLSRNNLVKRRGLRHLPRGIPSGKYRTPVFALRRYFTISVSRRVGSWRGFPEEDMTFMVTVIVEVPDGVMTGGVARGAGAT